MNKTLNYVSSRLLGAATLVTLTLTIMVAGQAHAEDHDMQLNPTWEYVADGVMGGVSQGAAQLEEVAGREAIRLRGEVSLDNNGGFIQVAFETNGTDATGLAFDVFGNGEIYEVRLRATQMTRPWQSYRAEFLAPNTWTTIKLPFEVFEPNKTDVSFDPAELRRIGFLAYGRAFTADLALRNLRLYE